LGLAAGADSCSVVCDCRFPLPSFAKKQFFPPETLEWLWEGLNVPLAQMEACKYFFIFPT
jgi:hypothetical protein